MIKFIPYDVVLMRNVLRQANIAYLEMWDYIRNNNIKALYKILKFHQTISFKFCLDYEGKIIGIDGFIFDNEETHLEFLLRFT
jgi:hypothetical protein